MSKSAKNLVLFLSAGLMAAVVIAAFNFVLDLLQPAAGDNYAAMVRNFERDAVDLIAERPDVTFDIDRTAQGSGRGLSVRQ